MQPADPFNEKIDKEYGGLMFDIKYDREQFRDPMTIGLLMYRLAQERKQGNELFREVLRKLDRVAALLERSPAAPGAEGAKALLSDIDAKIITQIQRMGKADARQIQSTFRYKGRNAACARLNALFQRGVLQKGRAGKRVVYWVLGGGLTQPPAQAPGG